MEVVIGVTQKAKEISSHPAARLVLLELFKETIDIDTVSYSRQDSTLFATISKKECTR